MLKKFTLLWREALVQVKMYKTHQLRTTFASWDVEAPLWREAPFEVQMLKTPHVRTTFGRSDAVFRGRWKGLGTLSKVSKTWGFCSFFKNDGTCGTFEEDLQTCIFRARRSTRDMLIRDVRRSGRKFSERGCSLEHQIFSFGKVAGLCMTWHHFFVAGAILQRHGLEKS